MKHRLRAGVGFFQNAAHSSRVRDPEDFRGHLRQFRPSFGIPLSVESGVVEAGQFAELCIELRFDCAATAIYLPSEHS